MIGSTGGGLYGDEHSTPSPSKSNAGPATPTPEDGERLCMFGELLQEEMDARGWTTRDVAARIMPLKVLEIDLLIALAETRDPHVIVSDDTLRELDLVFGTSEGFFQRLLRGPLPPAQEASHATPTPEGPTTLALMKRVKSFIEYARYVLEPGKAVFPDKFPKQVDADEAIGRCEEIMSRLASGPAVSPQLENVGTVEPDFHTVLSQRQFARDGQMPTSGATVPAAVSPQPEPPKETK